MILFVWPQLCFTNILMKIEIISSVLLKLKGNKFWQKVGRNCAHFIILVPITVEDVTQYLLWMVKTSQSTVEVSFLKICFPYFKENLNTKRSEIWNTYMICVHFLNIFHQWNTSLVQANIEDVTGYVSIYNYITCCGCTYYKNKRKLRNTGLDG